MKAALAAAALLAAPAAAAPTAHFTWFDYRGGDPSDAVPLGPGEYRNPVLHGSYSDPRVVRVGDDDNLVTSTFAWFAGISVLHSRDFVHWTQVANAVSRPAQFYYQRLGVSRGVFAPAITFHAGLFHILDTCVDCGGNHHITATDPKVPWSEPVWLRGIDGIDVSLFFDDDGRAWTVNNGPPPGTPRYPGHRAIRLQQFDPARQRMVGPRTALLDGGVDPAAKPVRIGGPHLFDLDLPAGFHGTGPNPYRPITIRDARYAGRWRAMVGRADDPLP